jgi:hypothetical protein
LALTELKYVSAKTRNDILQKNPRAKRLTQEERTPEQADHADEHETEVRGNDRKVDDLGGDVHGPENKWVGERRWGFLWPRRTNYEAALERMPVSRR